MSSCASSQEREPKYGEPYDLYKTQVRPLDLVLFRGGDLVSGTIRYIQKRQLGHGDYSHVGVIVTTEVLDTHPKMLPGKRYILESTATGLLGCGVKNIDGKAFFGVQITDFDELLEAYDTSRRTSVSIVHLRDRPDYSDVKPRLNAFWETMRGRSYEFNMWSMLSATFSFLRTYRAQMERVFGGGNWVFCSQLACMVYQACQLLPQSIESKDVVPEDLLGYDADKQVPLIFATSLPTQLLNRRWARKAWRGYGGAGAFTTT